LIQRLIVQARTIASQGGDPRIIAGILDDAEYLLGLQIQGNRKDFMGYLDGMMLNRPEVRWALSEYNSDFRKQQIAQYPALQPSE